MKITSTSIYSLLLCSSVIANTDTWKALPGSTDWSTASNWQGGTIPDGAGQTAVFGGSATTTINLVTGSQAFASGLNLNAINFNPAADAYSIHTGNRSLRLDGLGVVNLSSHIQNIQVDGVFEPTISFVNNADAGTGVIYTVQASPTLAGAGSIRFGQTASAGNAQFIVHGTTHVWNGVQAVLPASVGFYHNSTASTASFILNGSTVDNRVNGVIDGNGGGGGMVSFNGQLNGQSSAGTAVFEVNGGQAAGSLGGLLLFRNSTIPITASNASTADHATITNNGGNTFDAFGGVTQFKDNSTAAFSNITNMSGTFGEGGATKFYNNSTAANATIMNHGATGAAGTGGLTAFSDTATAGQASLTMQGGTASGNNGGLSTFNNTSNAGSATFTLNAAVATGGLGGQVEFHDTASALNGKFIANGGTIYAAYGGWISFKDHSTADHGVFDIKGGKFQNGLLFFQNDSTAANAIILNHPATADGGYGGSTQLSGNATAGLATITNEAANVIGAAGGWINLNGNSTAGNAAITNQGSLLGGFTAGLSYFAGTSSAGNAHIHNMGGLALDGSAGHTEFSAHSLGGTALITNDSGADEGAHGGYIAFTDGASADHATLRNLGSSLTNAGSGHTAFTLRATAGNADITNAASTLAGAEAGRTTFDDTATAGGSHIANQGGATMGTLGGSTDFNGQSTAGTATIINEPGVGPDTSVGQTHFLNAASADHSNITNQAGAVNDSYGGSTVFSNTSTAGAATIRMEGGAVDSARGGTLRFEDDSTASHATLLVNGSTGNRGGEIVFMDHATADHANLTMQGTGNGTAATYFYGNSTAADATFTNNLSGLTSFWGDSTAGHAVITNFLGGTDFSQNSTADHATIATYGATAEGERGGIVSFFQSAKAGHATITVNGATVAGQTPNGTARSYLVFRSNNDAENATLIANGSAGFEEGRIIFRGNSTGGNARAILHGIGSLDISGHVGTEVGLGSFEGTGQIFLGGKRLVFGATNIDRTFSGVISDLGGDSIAVGGALTKVGSGTLTLSGANSFSGGMIINGGTIISSHSSALGNGISTLNAGAILDPVTALHTGGLAWNGGRIKLAPAAGEIINLSGALTNGGAGGIYDIDFHNLAQTTYTLTNFANSNFTASQFSAVIDNPNPNIVYQQQILLNPNSVQLAVTGATATGLILQNSAPVFIPKFADFQVSGPVTTGTPTESNTIKSLNFAAGSSLTIHNDLVVSSGNFNIAAGSSVVSGGNIIVPGTFLKNGAGTLNLLSSVHVAGPTQVNSGALIVNGNFLTDGPLYVNHGALLGGAGTVFGNVYNAGTVSPGNSPGTLHIAGNYTQSRSGTLVIQIGSPKNYDRLAVSGSAKLDGTLAISTGKYRPARGDSFKVLTANRVAGTFSKVINPYPQQPGSLLYLGVDYTPKAVIIQTEQNTFANALSVFRLTPNQTATANALDSALHDVRQDAVLEHLDSEAIGLVPGDLDRIAPEELTSLFALGFRQSDGQNLSLQQRLADIRAHQNQPHPTPARTAQAASGKDKAPVAVDSPLLPTSEHYGVWFTQSGDFSDQSGTPNAAGYEAKSSLSSLGMDFRVSDRWILGFSGGYAHAKIDLAGDGSIKMDGGSISLYAMYHSDGGFFAEGDIGGGASNFDTRRAALEGLANGSGHTREFDASTTLGFDAKLKSLTLTPLVTARYTNVGMRGFREAGSLEPLDFMNQSQSSFLTRIGLRAAYEIKTGPATITPYASAQWQHEFLADDTAIEAKFANGSGDPFTVHGPSVGTDSFLLNAGLNVTWRDYALYLAYQADLGRKNYEQQSLLLGIRVSW